MTVKELIEKLKEFDEDIEVIADTQDWALYTVIKVEETELTTKNWEKVKAVYLS